MMTRDQAKAAARRVADWEKRQSDRLREAILVRYFGGCMCRMHNHVIAEEQGQSEGMDPRHIGASQAGKALPPRAAAHLGYGRAFADRVRPLFLLRRPPCFRTQIWST